MTLQGIKIDGVTYDVRIKYDTIKRSFKILEGENTGTSLSGRTIRDVIGTCYSFVLEVEPNPANPTAYDDFYTAISKPVDSHMVEMPYGQTTLTYEAQISSGTDTFRGIAGHNRWSGLSLTLTAMEPQVT